MSVKSSQVVSKSHVFLGFPVECFSIFEISLYLLVYQHKVTATGVNLVDFSINLNYLKIYTFVKNNNFKFSFNFFKYVLIDPRYPL